MEYGSNGITLMPDFWVRSNSFNHRKIAGRNMRAILPQFAMLLAAAGWFAMAGLSQASSVGPQRVVAAIETQLISTNGKLETIAKTPARSQPSVLRSVRLKIQHLGRMLQTLDPFQLDEPEVLADPLKILIGLSQETKALVLAFPSPGKGSAVQAELDLIAAAADGLIVDIEKILIGL